MLINTKFMLNSFLGKKKKKGSGTTIQQFFMSKNYKLALDSQPLALKCFLLSLKIQASLPRMALCPLGRRRTLSRMGEMLQRQFSPQKKKNFQGCLKEQLCPEVNILKQQHARICLCSPVFVKTPSWLTAPSHWFPPTGRAVG